MKMNTTRDDDGETVIQTYFYVQKPFYTLGEPSVSWLIMSGDADLGERFRRQTPWGQA